MRVHACVCCVVRAAVVWARGAPLLRCCAGGPQWDGAAAEVNRVPITPFMRYAALLLSAAAAAGPVLLLTRLLLRMAQRFCLGLSLHAARKSVT